MSQYPPPPAPPAPSFPGQPMYQGGFAPVPPKQSNGLAITSLVCGIIGCLGITALVAIITGFLGIAKANKPGVGGKGMAIAGIILGVLWLGIGAVAGGAGYFAYSMTKPVRDAASQFAKDLSAGKIDAAMTQVTNSITRDELQKVYDTMKTKGTITDTTLPVSSTKTVNGKTTAFVAGAATMSNGQAIGYVASLEKEGDVYKVDGFQFDKGLGAGSNPEP